MARAHANALTPQEGTRLCTHTRVRARRQVMVLVQLLKAIRAHEPTDKVVLVSNYTEALDILGKVGRGAGFEQAARVV